MPNPTPPAVTTQTGAPVWVIRELLADVETPVSAYWKLAHDEPYSFLLESVTGGEQVGRYSLLGVRPRVVLRTKNGRIMRDVPGDTTFGVLDADQDPLDLLKEELGPPVPISEPGLPPFAGGAVGMLAYDIVRYFERLPDSTEDDLNVDDMAMMLTSTVVAFDHAKNTIKIMAPAAPDTASQTAAQAEVDRVAERLQGPLPPLPTGSFPVHPVETNVTQEQFEEMVRRMIAYITQGDGVQMVPAQRFCSKLDAHPLTLYRALRSINPSPYMFLLRFIEFDVVGASPELLVSLHDGLAHVRPIAGTRWRGSTPEEDRRLGEELLADEKERAEHVMLVDLGRNDVGRVCKYGTVKVNDLMVLERYSHVMHIVSDVTGELRDDLDAYDLLRACFPAGTTTGAPKVRAMEIIDELEGTRRGSYAGAVGFISSSGNMDTCIALRTMLVKDGKAYIQAGGGVVYDSDPGYEYRESCNKARASLKAIEMAQRGL
ncbi:MAG TPA: anthranilate synthase component I [Fimbriimonadaceae bacterium]|nr:anthranilate synthase component I [Fimbriimonadaceae bacterium]